MKKNRNIEEVLNDGYLLIGKKTTLRDENRVKTGTKFVISQKLYFLYKQIREQDFMFFKGYDSLDSLKVKTYCVDKVRNDEIVNLNGDYYTIVRVDYDNDRKYMYLYLSKRSDDDEEN